MMICRRATYSTDSETIQYLQKTSGSNSKSIKTKNYVRNYARYTTLIILCTYTSSFLMVYVGTYDFYENSK